MFAVTKYINVPLFVISFAVGIFCVYMYSSDMRKIYIYPTPENVDILQYRDKTGTCFKYEQTETSCPSDESKITSIPMQG